MNNDQIYEAMVQKIRDAVLTTLEIHQEFCGDEKCVEPLNIVAYLAHSLGVRSEDLEMVKILMEKKEAEHADHLKTCTDPNHKH